MAAIRMRLCARALGDHFLELGFLSGAVKG